jgi:hypothetical protein
MKRFLMLVGVAAVAGAMYVAAAPGSRQAAAPTARQFAALKKQVASLNKKLKALTKDETSVKKLTVDVGTFIVGCYLSDTAGFKGVTRYGDPSSTYGFSYTSSAGATAVPRTALDFDTSATPGAYLQAVDPVCATASSSASASARTHAGAIRLHLRAAQAR